MSLNEFIFDSLENLDSFYIDYGKYIKELTPALYKILRNYEVKNWYLDTKEDKPCIVIKVDFWILKIE